MTFALTCIFTLLYFLRPFELFDAVRGMPLLLVVGGLAGLSLCLDLAAGRVKLFRNGSDQMMLGFYVAIALSHLSHGYLGGAVRALQDFFPILIGYFLVAHSIDSEARLRRFVALLILCASLLAAEGIMEVHKGASYFGVLPVEQGTGHAEDGTRIMIPRIKWVGPFSDPNDLAMVFVCVMPLLGEQLARGGRIVPLSLTGVVGYALYLTNSRGGLLALVTAVTSYLVLRYKSVKSLLFAGCCGVLLLIFGPSRMGDLSATEESASGRLDAWYNGYQMFKSAPIAGVGKGAFTDFNTLTAHNSFVLVLAELGFLGAFFFVGVFYFPLRQGYRAGFGGGAQGAGGEVFCLYNALLSGLVGILASMFFLSRSYSLLPYLMVALPMATVGVNRELRLALSGADRGSFRNILVVTMAATLFINVVVKLLVS